MYVYIYVCVYLYMYIYMYFCRKSAISENVRKRQEELETYWPVSFQFRPVA